MIHARSIDHFLLLAISFVIFLAAAPLSAASQTARPATEAKEKGHDCGDDDEDITEADRALVKISVKDAKLIALGRIPGKIMDAEFEKEHGRLQYAFDILGDDGKTYDVEIDAITGEVIQAELDDDDNDDDDGAAAKTVVKTKLVEPTVKAASSTTVIKKP
ncbi:MAG: PepSY domain-containing protein [Pyrinomonadaceae bacterium]